MRINFKIYSPNIDNENKNIVLLKGNLVSFNWKSLKEKIINNSKHLYFKKNNLVINDNDILVLKIKEPEKKTYYENVKEIFDERTFDYLLNEIQEKENEIKENDEEITIRFDLSIVKEQPKSNLAKYDIVLKEALNNGWKNEKERIMNVLNNAELTKRNIDLLNKLFIKNKKQSNKNIICNKCLCAGFFGPRYVCAYCNNYNLCYLCYKKHEHEPQHNFILIKQQIEENVIKYNNIITPNSQYLNNMKSSFKIKFKLFNTGETNLKDCFFTHIKFDENNLICKKYEIKGDFKQNSNKEIELEILYDDSNFNCDYDYEGHFRMFNKYGIPFGDILKIKIHNEFIRDI